MAEKITPRAQDFSQWYQDVVLGSELADYSPVKGCMVIRPNGYAIWEAIQSDLNRRIKDQGVRNAYFPLFIPESFIKKEAEHVEGFAPQVAVVTYAGGKELEEKLVVRPTSETIINSMFSKWIQSYRDLPLLINQWANVVRWEMRTRLFLRTTEFLWQEGHTCHATHDEAEQFARRMLKVYQEFSEETLAMPVICGIKTESEKFAGALRTYCIEAMMQDKKALQAGTSHNLSTHFAEAFETRYLASDGKLASVHQTSWGVSTRLIGGMVMTHSDDKGLILPPRLAETHVMIIPIYGKDAAENLRVNEHAEKLAESIRKMGNQGPWSAPIQVRIDRDESKKPGWKFHQVELLGVPIRLELGPKDLEKQQAVWLRRDIGTKEFLPLDSIPARVASELPKMQSELLERARAFRIQNTHSVESYEEFKSKLESEGGFFEASWVPDAEVEKRIKDETKATVRCLPYGADFEPQRTSTPCFITGRREGTVKALFARSY